MATSTIVATRTVIKKVDVTGTFATNATTATCPTPSENGYTVIALLGVYPTTAHTPVYYADGLVYKTSTGGTTGWRAVFLLVKDS